MSMSIESDKLLDIITKSAADFIRKSGEAESEVVNIANKAQTATGRQAEILRQVAEDSAAIERQKQLATLQAQNAARSIANAAGVNPTTGAGTILDLVAVQSLQAKQVAGKVQRLQELEQITVAKDGFFPWLGTQFEKGSIRDRLEGDTNALQAITGAVLGLNNSLQQAAQTTSTLKESVTASTIEASSRVAAADALIKEQLAVLEGYKYNTGAIRAAIDGPKERLDALYAVTAARRLYENQQLALLQFQFTKDRWEQDREDRQAAKDAKAAGKTIDELTLGYIKTARGALGLPDLDAREVQSILQMFKSGQVTKELQFQYRYGQAINTHGGAVPLGRNPSEVSEVIDQIQPRFNEQQAVVIGLLKSAQQLLDQSKLPQHLDTKENQGHRQKFINKTVTDEINRQYQKIQSGTDNLFSVGDIGSFIFDKQNNAPGIGSLYSLPISQKLFIPLIKAGQPLSDPKQVLGLTIESIRRGTITSSEAVSGIVDIYRRANEINQAARGFLKFGIAVPNAGKNYQAHISGVFGGSVIDLTNPVAVGQYFSNALSMEIQQENIRTMTPTQRREYNKSLGLGM